MKIADFGVSKLEQGTHLRTVLGTIGYSAPELLGLLPKRLRPREDVYTNAVDMWSLGCVVHELLTSEKPFLEVFDSTEGEISGIDPPEEQADVDMIIEFCRNERAFPDEVLQKSAVSTSATKLVKALMVPDPRLRISAAEALKSEWLSEDPQSDDVAD